MSDQSIVERIAISMGIKPAQLKTADLQAKLPVFKRLADENEKQAIAAEQASLTNRAKAFSPDTQPLERARLMKQSMEDTKRAKTFAGFASRFLTQLGQYTALVTTMQIADTMKTVGLISDKNSTYNWQQAMDSLQSEIQQMISQSQQFSSLMGSVLSTGPVETEDESINELNQLFAKWDAETDPEKRAEIQKLIEKKSSAALV